MFSAFQYEIKCNFCLYSGNLDSVALPFASPIQMNVRRISNLDVARISNGGKGQTAKCVHEVSKVFRKKNFL